MVRFKVRPKRETVPPPCLPALTSLLSCFATTGDLRANEQCANAARSLHTCMKGSKGSVKSSKSSINHLLSQASKSR